MKKIAFITIHVGSNFGSVLQTIATSETLKNMGYEPICVNYVPPRVTDKRFWEFGKGGLIKNILLLIWKLYAWPLRIINKNVYQGYLSKYCNLSAPFYKENNFKYYCPQADVYLTGSDQVWNVMHNEGIDTHYLFDGINGKKVSFASSIGNTEITEVEKSAFKKYLSDYSYISVREDTAVLLLEKLGFKAQQLLDPVFLLDKEKWRKYIQKERIIGSPYLLIYIPYNIVDKSVIYKHARYISKKENLKIVTFSWTYYRDNDADKTVRFASPGDFLDLMMNAEYVITNSFHGTAFSIDLNKKFWVFLPSGFTTRITSVLSRFGLSERLIVDDDVDDNWNYGKSIDFNAVNVILQQEREKSMSFLTKALL